jgi:hypothetical protein
VEVAVYNNIKPWKRKRVGKVQNGEYIDVLQMIILMEIYFSLKIKIETDEGVCFFKC